MKESNKHKSAWDWLEDNFILVFFAVWAITAPFTCNSKSGVEIHVHYDSTTKVSP